MARRSTATIAGWLVLLACSASCRSGCCGGDEEPPPMPSAGAASTPTIELQLEDASDEPGADMDAPSGDAAKPAPTISDLVKCCQVLASNGKQNPNPLVGGSMVQAASVCEGYARQNKAADVDALLRKFGMKCN